MQFPLSNERAEKIAQGLAGLVDVESGPSDEQRDVLQAFSSHLLCLKTNQIAELKPLCADQIATSISDQGDRRIFMQMAIMLELCRHPPSEEQLKELETYAAALKFDGPQLQAVRDLAHKSSAQATKDFLHVYDDSMPQLTEPQFRKDGGRPSNKDSLWQQLRDFATLPKSSLGREFFEFYQRNELDLPSHTTPNPGYYVAHDMNHVIAGYEPTGPGEIALGAFKLMMNNNEANWMGSMVNFLIHEVGLFKHAKKLQFVPYGGGGEPYHGIDGARGALTMDGATELIAESFVRGASCTADFAEMDHMANAHRPLADIRREFHVIPLVRSMNPQESPSLWPSFD